MIPLPFSFSVPLQCPLIFWSVSGGECGNGVWFVVISLLLLLLMEYPFIYTENHVWDEVSVVGCGSEVYLCYAHPLLELPLGWRSWYQLHCCLALTLCLRMLCLRFDSGSWDMVAPFPFHEGVPAGHQPGYPGFV